jgi:hypothetical protein
MIFRGAYLSREEVEVLSRLRGRKPSDWEGTMERLREIRGAQSPYFNTGGQREAG